MVETVPSLENGAAFPPLTPSIIVDLIGDLDSRLGEMAAKTISKLALDQPVVVSLRHLASVHLDGFSLVVDAIRQRTAFGRPTSIVSNGKKTQMLLTAAQLSQYVIPNASAFSGPTSRRLLLARHAEE